MERWSRGKKRIVLSIVVLIQLSFVLFCLYGMSRGKESYSFHDQKMQVCGGTMEASGAYVVSENTALPDQVFLAMELPGLKKGVYEVRIEYDADAEQVSRVVSETVGYRQLYENTVSLRPSHIQKEISYRFMLLEDAEDLRAEILYTGTGRLTVTDFRVVHTRQEYSMALFFVLFFSLVADVLFYFLVWNREKMPGEAERKILFGLFLIGLLSCANLLTDYTHLGDDAYFHLNRIEGIAREWMNGHFPARMESYCMFGMGYPMSIMYPEVFLWPAALLRAAGFDLSFCLKADIVFVNLLTVILSYFSFKNIFANRRIGLWGSAVYTLSLYRLYNIYDRAAIGEFIAMTFLPLICLGLARVFSEKEEEVRDRKTVFLLAFGYMGVLYSHVLSLEFVAVFTAVICLFLHKRFFRKSTFFTFVKAALLAVGLSLWYLIPFLDYSINAGLNVFDTGNPIQILGLYPAQLFWFFPWKGWSSYMYVSGMQYVRAYGMGIPLAVVFFSFLYLRAKGTGGKSLREFAEYPKIRAAAFVGILAMFMSLNIFPWDAVSEISEGLRKVVYSIQFPYRFLVIVTIAFCFLGCCLFAVLSQSGDGKKGTCFAVSILVLTVFGGSFYLNHEIQGRTWSDFREAAAMGSGMIGNGEYLPAGTDTSELPYTQAVSGEGVTFKDYKRENSHVEFQCENKGEADSYVECNLLYYPGYRAVNGNNGEVLSVVSGGNNVLRVKIPSGYKGKVVVDFVGKGYWKAGNAVSAVLWITVICSLAISYGKRRIDLAGCQRKLGKGEKEKTDEKHKMG